MKKRALAGVLFALLSICTITGCNSNETSSGQETSVEKSSEEDSADEHGTASL